MHRGKKAISDLVSLNVHHLIWIKAFNVVLNGLQGEIVLSWSKSSSLKVITINLSSLKW